MSKPQERPATSSFINDVSKKNGKKVGLCLKRMLAGGLGKRGKVDMPSESHSTVKHDNSTLSNAFQNGVTLDSKPAQKSAREDGLVESTRRMKTHTPAKPKHDQGGEESAPQSEWPTFRTNFASKCTFPQQKDLPNPPLNTWCPIPGKTFRVRCGPNYKKNGFKSPSDSNLFDMVAVRTFSSARRTHGIMDLLPLPPEILAKGDMTNVDKPLDIPAVLVVHFQLPIENPNMFKASKDGEGVELIMYLQPSARLLQESTNRIPPTPATTLFKKFYQDAQHSSQTRSRFKCMALVRDLESYNLGLLKPYNGKPVLITESGSCRKGIKDGISYLEITANIHQWVFLAKKGFVSLLPKFKDMRIDVGFSVESHEEEEMPECILGSCCMNYVDREGLVKIVDEIQRQQS